MTDMLVGKLLIVDDEIAHLTALSNTLGDHGFTVVGYPSPQEALAALRNDEFDVLLTDLQMPQMDGISLLRAALEIRPELVGVLMTGHGTIDTAVEAMKVGALDYILKPFKLSAALPVLSRAVTVGRLRLENAALNKRLREHAAELEVANADLERFASSVAHDLRGPLGTIGGFANILRTNLSSQMPADALNFVEKISVNVEHMSALIDGILQFSRLGRQEIDKQSFDVSALVNKIVASLREQHSDRSVMVRVHDLPACMGDPLLIGQVFFNLLSNALKFTRNKSDPSVEVGFQNLDGVPTYFVKDNGAGFDMKHARRLFGLFQRLHADDKFEGTGVGLSTVHRIVSRHGGRIWADAEIDKGATFYFTLPSQTGS